MAKKAPAKPAAKRKPRAKKPDAVERSEKDVLKSSSPWRRFMLVGIAVAGLAVSFGGGVWSAGGINIGPGPFGDVLQQSFAADRLTQAAVLRELSEKDFDGSTDEGRREAGEWFNAQRFRNRAVDYKPYTDAVAEAIAADKVGWMADELEGK